MARLSTHTNPTTPKSIDDVVSSLSPLERGRERYYKLLDVREAISSAPEEDLLVGDGIYVTLFCVTPEGTCELYWYDYDLEPVSDPESRYEERRRAEIGNDSEWHRRLSQHAPVFVSLDTKTYPKESILGWIDSVLEEPEIMRELNSVFESDVGGDDLYLAFY